MRIRKLLASLSLAVPMAASAEPMLVRMDTSMGPITMALYPDKAPRTVSNFLEYVYVGAYSGTQFHRVVPGFVIQGGGYDEAFEERPTRPPVKNESKNGLSNARGTVAMARTGDPDSARAQFFINLDDNDKLDAGAGGKEWGYAVFGKVVEGMDVVDKIAETPTGPMGPFTREVPQVPVLIEKMTVLDTPKSE